MLKGIGLILFGCLFLILAILRWRRGVREDDISLVEAGILSVTGEEPLPKTRLDHVLEVINMAAMFLFGPAMIALGILIIVVM
jgi:hypothetical protein